MEKPSNLQLLAICLIVGGVFSIMMAATVALASFCLWLPWIYGLIAGILAIIKGVKLMGDGSFGAGTPTTQSVLLIVNVINFDFMSVIMGVIALVMSQDHDTRTYLEGVEILD